MRESVARFLRRASEHLRRGGGWPRYFVRVATRFNEAVRIVYTAKSERPPWSDEAVSRVRDLLLEDQGVDVSVYAMHTRDRFDTSHALAVLARFVISAALGALACTA